MKLTWDDLLIQDVPSETLGRALSPWSFLFEGRVAPIFLNRFGSWFLQRPDGSVEMLDVLDGSVRRLGEDLESFWRAVNTPEWQEEYLLSLDVRDLHVAGKVAKGSDCYALAPHPVFGGVNPGRGDAVVPERVAVVSLDVWQSICRQAFGGPP